MDQGQTYANTKKISKTALILIIVVILVIVYGIYDFVRYYSLSSQINKLSQEVFSLKTILGLQASPDNADKIAISNQVNVTGQVKSTAGNIIALTGNVLAKDANISQKTDFRIAVASNTTIYYQGKKGSLSDIKAGQTLYVTGNANSFHPEEVTAEAINVMPAK